MQRTTCSLLEVADRKWWRNQGAALRGWPWTRGLLDWLQCDGTFWPPFEFSLPASQADWTILDVTLYVDEECLYAIDANQALVHFTVAVVYTSVWNFHNPNLCNDCKMILNS